MLQRGIFTHKLVAESLKVALEFFQENLVENFPRLFFVAFEGPLIAHKVTELYIVHFPIFWHVNDLENEILRELVII